MNPKGKARIREISRKSINETIRSIPGKKKTIKKGEKGSPLISDAERRRLDNERAKRQRKEAERPPTSRRQSPGVGSPLSRDLNRKFALYLLHYRIFFP